MSPYRTSETPKPCRHDWRVRVVTFNFGDPAVGVECSKCQEYVSAGPRAFFYALRLGDLRAATQMLLTG